MYPPPRGRGGGHFGQLGYHRHTAASSRRWRSFSQPSGQIEPRLHGRGSAEAQVVKKLSDIRERLSTQAKWEAVVSPVPNARPRIRTCRHTSSKSPEFKCPHRAGVEVWSVRWTQYVGKLRMWTAVYTVARMELVIQEGLHFARWADELPEWKRQQVKMAR